ncbi:MAG TPA: hypothetical protein VNH83_01915 [Bryobacteraceae bacterium]|jgi:hypothetical protein|nr:hypothetical protein [Bryobacteraceae bacterium]
MKRTFKNPFYLKAYADAQVFASMLKLALQSFHDGSIAYVP